MKPALFQMSQRECDRLTIIERIKDKQITQREGAIQLGLSTRQLRRLQQRHQKMGAQGLVSKKRGQPSNNRLSKALKQQALTLISTHYADFKPTLAQEKLLEKHKLQLSRESVRQLMMDANLWAGKKRRKLKVHQTRTRRSQVGELVQIDGSPHDWFEGRTAL